MRTRRAPRCVAFVTSRHYAALSSDDRLAVAALAALGVAAVPAVWDDPAVAWSGFDAIVLRSCWDYYHHPGRFRAWLDRAESTGVPLWNSPAVLRWNMDKRYLRDLEARGVAVPPTAWLERGAGAADLGAVLRARGWEEAVVKPAVSADGDSTWRVRAGDEARVAPALAAASARGGVMVQRFIPELAADGEWSCVFIGGEFSHAVLKRPADGEFRVQERYGGSSAAAHAPGTVLAGARHALRQAPADDWLYARVDGVLLGDTFTLLELEMLEPSLFFALDPSAPARFAAVVAERLGLIQL